MSGQIICRDPKRKKTWLVRIYMGETNGKRRYLNKTVHGTKKEAQAWLTKTLGERDTGMFVEPSKRTVAEYLVDWLSSVAAVRVSPRTARDYTTYATMYIMPPVDNGGVGDVKLSALTHNHVQTMFAGMTARGLSARTVRFAHTILKMAMSTAVQTRIVQRNACEYATLPKLVRKERPVLSPVEARAFLTAASADEWGAFFIVMLVLGLRPSEAAALKWTDIEGDRLRVQRALTPGYHGDWSLHEPKTQRSRRTVVIPPTAMKAFAMQKRIQAKNKMKAEPGTYASHDFIFAMPNGEPVHPTTLGKRPLVRILKAASLPRMRTYDLRHSSATLALASGEHPKIVSERLGHSSILLTLDTYSHVSASMQVEAAARMEALLSANA